MEQQFNRSTYVFLAKVIGIDLENLPRTEVGEEPSANHGLADWEVIIRFDPIENFKGESSEVRVIQSNSSGGTCGFSPEIAETWIFFVDKSGHTDQCSGNIPWGGYGWMKDFDRRLVWLRGGDENN